MDVSGITSVISFSEVALQLCKAGPSCATSEDSKKANYSQCLCPLNKLGLYFSL